jgi:hypothetical protein
VNSIEGSVKEKFVKIMEDFKVLTKDFNMNETFEEEGERFAHLKEFSKPNENPGGLFRNSMHERTRSQDYIMIEAVMPKYPRQKTSQIIFEEFQESPG